MSTSICNLNSFRPKYYYDLADYLAKQGVNMDDSMIGSIFSVRVRGIRLLYLTPLCVGVFFLVSFFFF